MNTPNNFGSGVILGTITRGNNIPQVGYTYGAGDFEKFFDYHDGTYRSEYKYFTEKLKEFTQAHGDPNYFCIILKLSATSITVAYAPKDGNTNEMILSYTQQFSFHQNRDKMEAIFQKVKYTDEVLYPREAFGNSASNELINHILQRVQETGYGSKKGTGSSSSISIGPQKPPPTDPTKRSTIPSIPAVVSEPSSPEQQIKAMMKYFPNRRPIFGGIGNSEASQQHQIPDDSIQNAHNAFIAQLRELPSLSFPRPKTE